MYMNYFKGEQYMFCTKCGAKNPEDATFCYKCGNEMYLNPESPSDMPADDKKETYTTIFGNEYTIEDESEEEKDINTFNEVSDNKTNPLSSFWGDIINFNGKMSRYDFWSATIVMAAVNIILLAICGYINSMLLWYFYDLFFLIATLSASVRRLHDINKSGAYVLLNLIPLVGQVILLIMLLQKGKAKSYSEAWWSGLFAASTLLLLLGGVYVVTTAYEYYQEQQELQEYRDDLDKSINDLENNSYDSDYDY